ncbi:MAG: hypothetical protein Q8P90_06045 [bacterium]|nr:hypothetical protein [bacterium]
MSDTHYTVPVAVQRLIKSYNKETHEEEARVNVSKLKISEAIGRLAFFYEKIRNSVDYQEENLIIKSAIERILRRKFIPGEDPALISGPLLSELIRGGYIQNNSYPESIVDDVTKVITKYARFLNKAIPPLEQEQREGVFDWTLTMLACELEDLLSFSWQKQGMLEFVYLTMLERVEIKSKNITADERKVQIYSATLRTYAQYDFDLTSYHLLKYFYPDWKDNKEDTINRVAKNVLNVKATIEKQINHPLQDRLIRQLKKVNILFLILADVLSKHDDPLDLLQDVERLEDEVEEAATEKYKTVKSKLRRTSIRSIIYIIITKMMLALIIELPYDLFILGHLNYIPIAINVIFHPTLLFIIALVVHIPAKENTEKIKEGVKDLIYSYPDKDIKYQVKPKAARSGFTSLLFKLFYVLAYFVTFGGILLLLFMIGFNWLGMLLFVLFLTLVSFFGFRVRQLAKDLVVVDRKDNIISATIDFFAIPVIRAGHWLSVNFSKINVFVFILDVIIEAPFKLIIEVFEDWLGYIREKREELYD